MVLIQKIKIFPTFFFRQYRPGKCLLRYCTMKKRLSRLQKQEFQKVEKFDIFPKGLTNGFGPKMAVFPIFFMEYWPGKCLLRYSRVKKRFSRLQKQEVQKVEKLEFFKIG